MRLCCPGVITTTVFYISVGCFGYSAFGNNAPANLLTGFAFYEPFWLIHFANACIVVHLVGAYQVYCQPVFAYVEKWASGVWPKSSFINREYRAAGVNLNLFRLGGACSSTIASMLLPYILGLLGAMAFWPLTVYFPIDEAD